MPFELFGVKLGYLTRERKPTVSSLGDFCVVFGTWYQVSDKITLIVQRAYRNIAGMCRLSVAENPPSKLRFST